MNGPFTVKDGGSLTFSGWPYTYQNDSGTSYEFIFNQPITVDGASSLSLNSVGYLQGTPSLPTTQESYKFSQSGNITVNSQATLNIESSVDLSVDENVESAPIQVKGGTVNFASKIYNVNQELTAELTSSGTSIIEMTDGEVNLTDGVAITSSGTAPAIQVTGGTLNLNDGTITTTNSGTPAVQVGEDATVVIPENSTITVTSADNQAVSLAKGATVKMANTSVTVGDNEDGESYIDNNGITVLGRGAKSGDASLQSALILRDGTIVQGTETEKPTYQETTDGEIVVTVPKGGSVTNASGQTTQMDAGGTVTSTGDTIVNAENITLNRSSVSLYSNTDNNSVQLTATVNPPSLSDELEWSSSNDSVATVDETGLVTAHSNGTAKITASVGATTATCTVYVSTYTYTGDYNYPVTIGKTEHGTVTIAKEDQWANDGEKITVTVTPDDAYMLDELVIKDKAGNELQVKDNGDGTYTFTMPEGAVTITATFVEDPDWVEPEPEEPTPEPSTDVTDTFNDVTPGAWYVDVVQYAYDHGLMTGTSATTFEPDTTTSRAMIVSILHRLEGSPNVGTSDFFDVASGAWYAAPVAWAAENGIVAGFEDGTFGPNDPITREQMASILYRYAEYKGIDTSARATLDAYSDAGSISPWATDVVSWANAVGLMNGVGENTLDPQGTATRAQVAAMLQRFIENVL